MNDQSLCFNGIDGTTGDYSIPPTTIDAFAGSVRAMSGPFGGLMEQATDSYVREVKWWARLANEATFLPAETTDPGQLGDTGWGVVFSANANPEIQEALRPLLDLRRAQASAYRDYYFRVLAGPEGFRPHEDKYEFLTRRGVMPARPADPQKMPYYLLLVGGPEEIPYSFQVQLGLQYAVGRLHFDTAEEYARYAQNVVNAEASPSPTASRLVAFGPTHQDDAFTRLNIERFLGPLFGMGGEVMRGNSVTRLVGKEATKYALRQLLQGPEPTDILLVAGHGMTFAESDPRQSQHQGAFLCTDWPGPIAWSSRQIPEDFYFSDQDLEPSAPVSSRIIFCLSSFALGVRDASDLGSSPPFSIRPPLVPRTSRLAQRLLAHPKGGALAVVGYVDRSWAYALPWQRDRRQISAYVNTLKRLNKGVPVGAALEHIGECFAEWAITLQHIQEDAVFGTEVDLADLVGLWCAVNDTHNIQLFGDPAVRIGRV